MSNYSSLKATINANVKTNNNQEITGAIMNSVLNAMVNTLGVEFQFGGVITPSSTITPSDGNIAYIGGAGTYTNISGAVIADGFMGVFMYNGSWTIQSIQVGKNYDTQIEEMSKKLEDVSVTYTTGDDDSIVIKDSSDNVVATITSLGCTFKNLKSNGNNVLTESNVKTINGQSIPGNGNIEIPTIDPNLLSEQPGEELDDSIHVEDESGNTILELTNDGLWYARDRFLKGKKIRIFGGSVAWAMDNSYDVGNLFRLAGATLLDSAQSGAGFANNISIVDGEVVYNDVNIQQQVDVATAPGQTKYDIYILWASTNDLNTYSVQVGDPEDYTIVDNFDISKRLTQDGAINYCIKQLCTFAPEAKVVIIGSLKRFEDGGGWSEFGAGLNGRLKSLVDGQQLCAERSSLPFFSLWENSGFNEYNNNTYFFKTSAQYPSGHNDGTHPNETGYVVIANKILNFLKTI